MDPVATLKELDEAMRDGDRELVSVYASALARWLELGGFMPIGPQGAADWRGELTALQLASHCRALACVAEMRD